MRFRPSPAVARILPFAAYIGFIVLESLLPDGTIPRAWLYGMQVSLTGALLLWLWPHYAELRPAPRDQPRPGRPGPLAWLAAAAVGIAVFILWINLDLPWARFGESRGLVEAAGEAPAVAVVALRVLGAVLIVPIMEELFWRSFLMRWIDNPRFLELAPQSASWKAIIVSSVLFAAEHHLWLAGMLAGLAFALLYRRTGSLWLVIAAHAVTNAALELWVWRTGSFQFI